MFNRLRSNYAHYVRRWPDMVDQFQELSPGNIRISHDEHKSLGAVAHDFPQP
jgi:hypothetical protein